MTDDTAATLDELLDQQKAGVEAMHEQLEDLTAQQTEAEDATVEDLLRHALTMLLHQNELLMGMYGELAELRRRTPDGSA